MTEQTNNRGRPRAFDTEQVLQRSVEVFWQQGFSGTTTRTLERSLGISQSSLYNAFGSKEGLFHQVITRYEHELDSTVLAQLDQPTPDRDAIQAFLDAVADWVSDDDHRGCLVLNLATESADGQARVAVYRHKLRELLTPAVASFTDDDAEVEARTELLIAAVLGLNISARSGASQAELVGLRNGIKHQVRAW